MAVVLALVAGLAGRAAPATAKTARTAVVVRSTGGSQAAAAAVRQAGGAVTRSLGLVGGVAATVPAGALARLAAVPGVEVAPDERLRVQESTPASAGTSVYRDVVGASDLAAGGNRGDGVTVALVDTGVAPVADLAGRVVPVVDDVKRTTSPCLDLSGEGDCVDRYGHGTFTAGIIAGDGTASAGRYTGVAPGARLVSVKVAGRDGSCDVSTVLAAIQWVVSFKDRYGIRVLNLSLGTDSTQSYRSDPLDYAVERAWAAGIAVVVAASNRGPEQRTISKPGDDPFVITVGAVDDHGTVPRDDDRLPDFSSRGPTAADGLGKPDVAAPGAHLVSTSSPGSDIATNFPSSAPAGYQIGSGTSMATAVVSGVAALLVKADPTVTPDRLKYALMSTARPGPVNDPLAVGSGVVDARAALAAGPGLANRNVARSNGMGSLDLSRGNLRVQTLDPAGMVVSGTQTAQLVAWDPTGMLGVWSPTTWYTSLPYLYGWRAVTWSGSKWQGSKWQGSKWQGGADPTSTYGSKWQGSDWYGAWQ
ncbi:MAG TPA: S8 family peptidase [Dermatophilaceae bacterium]|nr:S8 family peptidase [Dermatophilaceae bacterium]